ncbi:MAG: ribbon-helix-helix protein, CopG family, partial [Acetobacteraceae bacterium]
MAATARVVVLMSPEEKAALEAKAARAGRLSAGELVRRAVDAYDEDAQREAEELRVLLDLFAQTHAK